MATAPLTLTVTTSAGPAQVQQIVADSFTSSTLSVTTSGSTITVSGPCSGSFGPYLTSETTVTVERYGKGYLLQAVTSFRPSGVYWGRGILGLVVGLAGLVFFPPLVVLAFTGFLLPLPFRSGQQARAREDVEARLRGAAARLSLI